MNYQSFPKKSTFTVQLKVCTTFFRNPNVNISSLYPYVRQSSHYRRSGVVRQHSYRPTHVNYQSFPKKLTLTVQLKVCTTFFRTPNVNISSLYPYIRPSSNYRRTGIARSIHTDPTHVNRIRSHKIVSVYVLAKVLSRFLGWLFFVFCGIALSF